MSYAGFAGYACHPSQLTLMGGHGHNPSISESPCCPSSDSSHSAVLNVNNTNMSGGERDRGESSHIEPSVSNGNGNATPSGISSQSHQQLSASTSSVCHALTSPYESRLISSYPRLSGLYGTTYSTEQSSFYASAGTNPFYSSFGHPYDIKESNINTGAWGALPQHATCYPYDPTIYSPYGDRYSAMDSAARRKNATRETTNTLKAWLYEHRKNPYPTKGEKIMLAIITKMTLTQVSTWFANARRRLKKENKMTWEPRNKSGDGDGHDSDGDKDSCKDSDDNSSSEMMITNDNLNQHTPNGGNGKLPGVKKESDSGSEKSTDNNLHHHSKCDDVVAQQQASSYQPRNASDQQHNSLSHNNNGHENKHNNSHLHHPDINHSLTNGIIRSISENHHHIKQQQQQNATIMNANELDSVAGSLENLQEQRPKIWSLAQTATSGSPPYRMPSNATPEWSANLPSGPDGANSMLSDYQSRECPQPMPLPLPPALSTTGFCRAAATSVWPEDNCVTGLGNSSRSSRVAAAAMQLFTSSPIGATSYLHSHSGKPAMTTSSPFPGASHHHHNHHPFSSSMPHLVHANHNDSSSAFSSSATAAYNAASNSLKPIIDPAHSCQHLATEISENRITNGLTSSYNNGCMASSSHSNSNSNSKPGNTFFCKVFPEYISSGTTDALSLTDNSERGGSSVEDASSASSSPSNIADSHSHALSSNNLKNLNGQNLNTSSSSLSGLSAFRPMLKR